MQNPLIQVVDDNERNIKICREILEMEDFSVISSDNGKVGLQMAGEHRPDVILLDIMMPVMNGMEMLRKLKSDPQLQHIPILMLTAKSSTGDVVQALDAGANDYLTKPFSDEELGARVKTLYRMKNAEDQIRNQNVILEQKVRERTAELNDTRLEIVRRLGLAAEYRDTETGDHIIRMSKMCMKLGELCGMNDKRQELLLNASPMHDIGKISIPDAVMLKPGKLTAEEWEIMTQHTTIGARLLDGHDSLLMRTARDIALTHHEKWNGNGYPAGLKGKEIPLVGRIAAIADVFDSLTSRRPYKDPYPIDFACQIIEEERGKQFDPEITDLFLNNKSIFDRIKRDNSDEIAVSGNFQLSDRDKELK
ncbi:MAG TPA: response regulator [Desulfocapsa sulfexigens]|nr:response regulator [Desulfocapsa sulfexigens]